MKIRDDVGAGMSRLTDINTHFYVLFTVYLSKTASVV